MRDILLSNTISNNWLTSAGGPLILLEKEFLSNWKGVFSNDYNRACAISDYIGLINVGQGKGLIIGDEPFPTLWLPQNKQEGLLVCWNYAENEEEVLKFCQKIPEKIWKATNLNLEVLKGPLILFDSAASGNDLLDSLSIGLIPGAYQIKTAIYEPNPLTSLIIHKISIKNSSYYFNILTKTYAC